MPFSLRVAVMPQATLTHMLLIIVEKSQFIGIVGEGRPKWAPEVKWATPITANMVKAMAKVMMPVSSPSREGTMECVACEVQHKNKQ